MVRALLIAGLVAVVVANPAQAKGPDRAVITGPGLEAPLIFSGYGADGKAPLGLLTQEGGFWVQVFDVTAAGVDQGRRLAARPAGDLGPRYVVTYRVPGPTTASLIRQELYPYAATPVSYMGRQRFWRTRTTRGGWYRWGSALKAALIQAGLPATASAARSHAAGCAVTKSRVTSRRFGTSRLSTILPAGGVLRVQRNVPDDGHFGTKLGWIPDRDRGLTLTVSGRRMDAPGRMKVRGVYWGHSSTGEGSWASAVAFPAGGCWRITGRAGPTTLSFVVRVKIEG